METQTNDLTQKTCKPCEGGVDPMERDRAQVLVGQIEGWKLTDDGRSIEKEFGFGNFYQTMAFVNAMAWIANQEDHHPDFCTGYKYCKVTYTTHALGGLSENDFICAAKINALVTES